MAKRRHGFVLLVMLALPFPALAQDDGSGQDPAIQPPPGIAPTPTTPIAPPPIPPPGGNGQTGSNSNDGPATGDVTFAGGGANGTVLPPGGPGLPGGPIPPVPGLPGGPTTPTGGGVSYPNVSKGRVSIPTDREAAARELGRKLFASSATSLTGRSCADCHSARFLAKVAHVYPRYHILERDVLTRAEAIDACARRWMRGWALPPGSPQGVALELYLESLVGSDG